MPCPTRSHSATQRPATRETPASTPAGSTPTSPRPTPPTSTLPTCNNGSTFAPDFRGSLAYLATRLLTAPPVSADDGTILPPAAVRGPDIMRALTNLAALAVLAAVSVAFAADPPPRYEFKKDHDPDGIGKFYMGREIAQVMGFPAAGWLDRTAREKEEEPAKLLEALKLRPGDVVADVGAGSGYYTF